MMERQSDSEMHRECHTESQSEDDCEGLGMNEEQYIKTVMQCGGAEPAPVFGGNLVVKE